MPAFQYKDRGVMAVIGRSAAVARAGRLLGNLARIETEAPYDMAEIA